MSKTPETISPIELASLSGYTPQRIRQLQADGILPKVTKRGELPLRESAAALIGYMREKLTRYSESRASSLNREGEAKAALAEITLHERIGNLVPTYQFEFFAGDLGARVRSIVQSHRQIPEAIGRVFLTALADVKVWKDHPRPCPTCPRCRIPIFADIDPGTPLLEIEKHHEKDDTHRKSQRKKSPTHSRAVSPRARRS